MYRGCSVVTATSLLRLSLVGEKTTLRKCTAGHEDTAAKIVPYLLIILFHVYLKIRGNDGLGLEQKRATQMVVKCQQNSGSDGADSHLGCNTLRKHQWSILSRAGCGTLSAAGAQRGACSLYRLCFCRQHTRAAVRGDALEDRRSSFMCVLLVKTE
jgi:hypothetical protein